MSTDEELDRRRREIREEFLNKLKSIGIEDDEGAQLADTIEKSVSAVVAELFDRPTEDS